MVGKMGLAVLAAVDLLGVEVDVVVLLAGDGDVGELAAYVGQVEGAQPEVAGRGAVGCGAELDGELVCRWAFGRLFVASYLIRKCSGGDWLEGSVSGVLERFLWVLL